MTVRGARGLVALVLVASGWTVAAPWRAGAVHHRIVMQGLLFVPARVEVAPGDTVTWTNADIVPHTATGPEDTWDSGNVARGERFTWVVPTRGEWRYVCRYHPTMTGSLVAH